MGNASVFQRKSQGKLIDNNHNNNTHVRKVEEIRQEEYYELYTIIVVGDIAVGKSSLIIRYIDDTYTDSYINTIGVEFKIKTITINGIKIKLQIIDISGEKRFPIGAWRYKKAQGWMIMYDVTDRTSFNHINLWLEQIRQYGDYEHSVKYIVGNKCDLEDLRVVPTDEGKAFAAASQLVFFETSAKTSIGIKECFTCMGSDILIKK